MNTARMLAKSKSFLKRQSPTILTCIGAVGVVATAVTAVRATPKALELIEESYPEPSNAIETVKVAWKPYIPSIIIGTATISCIFGANVLNRRQQAALTSAYIFLERSYKEYKDKVKAVLGEEAAKQVDTEIVKDKLTDEDMLPTSLSADKCLFYEEHYGQFFERTMLEVRDAEYQLNRKLSKEGEASLNDFMELLDLPKVKHGDILGWSQEDAFDFYNYTWIEFEHELLIVGDDMECYEIKTTVAPIAGYDVPF